MHFFSCYATLVLIVTRNENRAKRGTNMEKTAKSLLLAGAFTCALLTGCAEKNQVVNFEDTDPVVTTISFFGNKYEPENVRVIEEILSGFMKEYPDIRISYESLKGADYFDALGKRISSDKGDDVFMVNHDTLLDLEQSGKVVDLSGMEFVSGYTDAMLSQMKEEDGAIYWVPTTVSMFGLYCNMDLLEEHRQDIPQNLGEWEAVCDYFVDQGITPVVANNDISLKTLAIGVGFYQVYQEGRQEAVFDGINSGAERLSDYLRPGFALVSSFLERGYIDAQKALVTKKTSGDLQEFAQGKSPFMLTGAWAAGRFSEMSPGFSFKVAPLPVLRDGAMVVINADTRLSINADSGHLDAAMKFVEYFTRTENIQRFADQQASLSPQKGGSYSSVEAIQPLIPCYEAGHIVFGSDGGLELPIWELTAEVSKKLLSGEELDSALEWMELQIEEDVAS